MQEMPARIFVPRGSLRPRVVELFAAGALGASTASGPSPARPASWSGRFSLASRAPRVPEALASPRRRHGAGALVTRSLKPPRPAAQLVAAAARKHCSRWRPSRHRVHHLGRGASPSRATADVDRRTWDCNRSRMSATRFPSKRWPDSASRAPSPHSVYFTATTFTPSSWNKNDSMSVVSSISAASGVPMPWPVSWLARRRMGRSDDVAACRRAVILRE